MPTLGVNIDHIATIRQARYREMVDHPNAEPDPVAAALEAERAGAHGITAHLREDRRHIQDRDIHLLREKISTKLNLEMGSSEEILRIALDLKPNDVCIVPENRREVTTEGGLNCRDERDELSRVIDRLKSRGIRVSLFVDPDEEQVSVAGELGADFVELHTGAYSNSSRAAAEGEIRRLVRAAECALSAKLRVNAGHGLNYSNLAPILTLPGLEELNIGHSIVARSAFVGISRAVSEMCDLIAGR